jgi:hypothetical protein
MGCWWTHMIRWPSLRHCFASWLRSHFGWIAAGVGFATYIASPGHTTAASSFLIYPPSSSHRLLQSPSLPNGVPNLSLSLNHSVISLYTFQLTHQMHWPQSHWSIHNASSVWRLVRLVPSLLATGTVKDNLSIWTLSSVGDRLMAYWYVAKSNFMYKMFLFWLLFSFLYGLFSSVLLVSPFFSPFSSIVGPLHFIFLSIALFCSPDCLNSTEKDASKHFLFF